MSRPLWTPTPEHVERTNLARFTAHVRRSRGLELSGYDALYDWSVTDLPAFWESVWQFTAISASRPWTSVLSDPSMPGARWFEGARLNFAENLLRFRTDDVALLSLAEGGGVRDRVTYTELHQRVARFARFLEEQGVTCGDRVAGFMPNVSETVVAMLAAASLGAVWSSCSPDFGFKGVMDRFGQIAPKVLVTADGYHYNGRAHDSLDRVRRITEAIPSIERTVVVPMLSESPALEGIRGAVLWPHALENDATDVTFVQLPFDHPLYVMYSSGTTGVPKCIVHGAGGTLLQHAKEHALHGDLRQGDAIFYFTTCGWMMWNWLVSALFTGATVILYDGSPAYPDAGVLWRMAEEVGLTHFGTSPKFLSTCAKAGLVPRERHDLGRLRVVMSTGAPLSAENFAWVYSAVKQDVQLASISGGTDIISCFMLGSPVSPVYPGEIQKRGLGMKVEAWAGPNQPVVGEKGELVCTAPFPSMPVGFWNDPDGARYRAAYFEHFPGVWRHGDFIEITTHGGVIVHGRSDATLNPGGVRIGTAEIYRQVEALDEVVDSVVVGQQFRDDTRVVLFVVLRDGLVLDDALRDRIKRQIRANTTPRHVPAVILQAPAVPRTISGKKVELAVTQAIHGQNAANRDALANPEALDWYRRVEGL